MRLLSRANYVLFLTLLILTRSFGDQVDDLVQNIEGASKIDYRSIPQERKSSIISQLKYKLQTHSYAFQASDVEKGLVNLNDRDTLINIADRFRSGESTAFGILQSSDNPAIVSWLGDDLLRPEDVDKPWTGGDTIEMTTRGESTSIILNKVRRLPEFPQKTRAWADNLPGSFPLQCALLTQWWQHNKEALQAQRFQDATWLPSDSGLGAARKDPYLSKNLPSQAALDAVNPSAVATPGNSVNHAGPATSTSVPFPSSSQSIIIVTLFAALIALLGSFVYARRQRLKK